MKRFDVVAVVGMVTAFLAWIITPIATANILHGVAHDIPMAVVRGLAMYGIYNVLVVGLVIEAVLLFVLALKNE